MHSFAARNKQFLNDYYTRVLSRTQVSPAMLNVWNRYVVPIMRNTDECNTNVDRLAEGHGTATAGKQRLPDFATFLEGLLQNREQVEKVMARGEGAFSQVLDEYVRQASALAVERLRGSLVDREQTENRTRDIRRELRRWMTQDLLRLHDYLGELSGVVEQSDGSVPPEFKANVGRMSEDFNKVLETLGVTRIPVQVNRDQVRPEVHQIVQRNGQGQTIIKVTAHGFTWEGEPLRKSDVWVA